MLKPQQIAVLDITDLVEQVIVEMAVGTTEVELRLVSACQAISRIFAEVPRQQLPEAVALRIQNLRQLKLAHPRDGYFDKLGEEVLRNSAREIVMLYADLISTARKWKGGL